MMEADPRSVWEREPWIVTDQADTVWLEQLGIAGKDLRPFLPKQDRFFEPGLPRSARIDVRSWSRLRCLPLSLTVFLAGRRFSAIGIPGHGYFYDPVSLLEKLEQHPVLAKQHPELAAWRRRLAKEPEHRDEIQEYFTDHSVQPDVLQAMIALETPLLLVYTESRRHRQDPSQIETFYRSLLGNRFPPDRQESLTRGHYTALPLWTPGVVLVGNAVETVRGAQLARALPLEQIAQEIRAFLDGIATRSESAMAITDDQVLRDAKGFGNCSFKSCHPGRKRQVPR